MVCEAHSNCQAMYFSNVLVWTQTPRRSTCVPQASVSFCTTPPQNCKECIVLRWAAWNPKQMEGRVCINFVNVYASVQISESFVSHNLNNVCKSYSIYKASHLPHVRKQHVQRVIDFTNVHRLFIGVVCMHVGRSWLPKNTITCASLYSVTMCAICSNPGVTPTRTYMNFASKNSW